MRFLFIICLLLPFGLLAQSPVPFGEEAPFARAEAAFQAERYEVAIPIYDSLLRVLPPNGDRYAVAATRVGRCHIDLGDYPKALIPLRRAAAVSTISPALRADAYLELGFALWLKGRPDSLITYAQAAANLLPSDAHPSLRVRQLLYLAIGQSDMEQDREALPNLRQAEQLIRQQPTAVSAYDQARVYAWLCGRYAAFGWEKSRKNALKQFQTSLAAIPKQEIRWGHLALDGHGLFDFSVGDSLTQRVEKMYARRLGLGSLGRAYALSARTAYLSQPQEKLMLLDQALATVQMRLGASSPQVTNLLEARMWPVYNLQYPDSAVGIARVVYQRHLTQGGNWAGQYGVYLINMEALYRLIGDERARQYSDSLAAHVKKNYSPNSLAYAAILPSLIETNFRDNDLPTAWANINALKTSIVQVVGDSSTRMLTYYNYVAAYYDKQNKYTEQIQALQQADAWVTTVYGSDDEQRISIVGNIASAYFFAKQYDKHEEWRREEHRLLLLNPENTSTWYLLYKYNIGYRLLTATMQRRYEVADALLVEFEQSVPADDPDYARHLSECASLATLCHNNAAHRRYLSLAVNQLNADQQSGKYNLSTHLSITDELIDAYIETGQCDSIAHYLDLSRQLSARYKGAGNPDNIQKFSRKERELCECRGCDQIKLVELMQKEIEQAEKNNPQGINPFLYGILGSDYKAIGAEERAEVYGLKMLEGLRRIAENNPNSPNEQIDYWAARGRLSTDTNVQAYCYRIVDSIALLHRQPIAWLHGRRLKNYHDIGNYTLAVHWGQRTLEAFDRERMSPQDSVNLVIHLTNLGEAYWNLNDLSNSDKYYQMAFQLLPKVYHTRAEDATIRERLAFWRRTQGDYAGSIAFAQQGLQLLSLSTARPFDPVEVFDKPGLARDLYYRIARAYGLWYDATGNLAYNDSAYWYSTCAIRTLHAQNAFAQFTDPSALQNRHTAFVKFSFEENLKALYVKQQSSTNQTQLRREAFSVSEQWRAPAFRQELASQKKQTAEDAELANRLLAINKAIDANQTLKVEAEQRGSPLSYYADIIDHLNRLYAERESLQKQISQRTNLNASDRTASVEQVQARLRSEQTLVEYVVTDSLLVTFVIRPDTFLLFFEKNDQIAKIGEWATQLRQQLSNPAPDYNDLVPAATGLHALLIAPIESWLTPDVVFVTDGPLAALPFQAFLSQPVSPGSEPNTYPWLLHKYNMSYQPSATVWLEIIARQPKSKPKIDFLGMAPSYVGLDQHPATKKWTKDPGIKGTRGYFGPLTNNIVELDNILALLGPDNKKKPFRREQARRSVFEQEAPLARIIHLAIHAKGFGSSGDRSFLVFAYPADSVHQVRLFARDIARLELVAEMVVLSGCETGYGSNLTGEGVIGLGRAFAMAGAKSLVLSLWSVDDQSTSDLMTAFYQNLKANQPKHTALRNAQLQLIKQGEAPFHWAPFVLYGDGRSIRF
jgi:CHAT domain-containing protein